MTMDYIIITMMTWSMAHKPYLFSLYIPLKLIFKDINVVWGHSTQLAEHLPSMDEALGLILSTLETGHGGQSIIYNPSTQEVEAGNQKLKVILRYIARSRPASDTEHKA